ncbi:MAG: fimbrillin family protein [Prevotella sp.]
MKKVMLFTALAAAGLFVSCSSEDNLGPEISKNDLQQIKIGFGATATVGTRGTGTVGGIEDAENPNANVWNGQSINIFMFNKGTLDLAEFEQEGAIYDNTKFFAPTEVSQGIATASDNIVKYYPTTGAFDFWGYHLDGCETDVYNLSDDGTAIEIPFTLTGSEDIMAGKAVPTEEEINATVNEEGTPQPERIYSAFAARRNIQPNITFKHLLTRLAFQVKGGTSAICDEENGVRVTGIEVESKTTGKLIAAYTGDEVEQLVFNDHMANLVLMQRAGENTNEELVALDPVTPEWDVETDLAKNTPVGEALLVAPSDSYKIIIRLSQTVKDNEIEGTTKEQTFGYETTISTESGFVAGNSYNVVITVFGLSEIQITTTLTPWVDGGTIDVFPEDDGNRIE